MLSIASPVWLDADLQGSGDGENLVEAGVVYMLRSSSSRLSTAAE
jgi:hypothetical protein